MIEFPNKDNFSDHNVFVNPKPGYLKITENGSELLLDINAWQTLFGWEINGTVTRAEASLDPESLMLNLRYRDLRNLQNLMPGPFEKIEDLTNFNADPRRLK